MKKILFLTTHNLATNPRVYKEAQLALQNDYKVEIVCFEFDNWSYQYNQELKQKLAGATIHTIPAGRKPLLPWLTSSFTEWLYRKMGYFFELPASLLSQAVSKRSRLLVNKLKEINSADLVVAHNPGALWPAIWFSKKINGKAGFDMEDYHPGETKNVSLKRLTESLLKKSLHHLNYVSFASPLIKSETEKLINAADLNSFTVLNYFSRGDFLEPGDSATGIVRFIWFSQNISFNRGLEMVLPVFSQMSGKAELHLFGNIDENFYQQYLKQAQNIILHKSLPQLQLHQQLSWFDIGLAIEPGKDLNNELAVSNKLLAYLQAGLFVVATDTPAQKDLLNQYPGNGICFNVKQNNFKEAAEQIIFEINNIRSGRIKRYMMNRGLSWENESARLLYQWKQLTDAG